MVFRTGLTTRSSFSSLPLGMRGPLFEGETGTPPSGGQPTTPPPATEGTGTTPGATGGAGTTPAGGNPAQPQPIVTPPAAPAATPAPWVPKTPEEIAGVNALMQARLAEEATRAQTAAQQAAAQKEQEKKLAQGLYKDVADEREKTITQLQEQLATERRARIAAKHNLPADVATRLVGTTEDELDADAKKLAALLKPAPAPRTEAGAGNRPPGSTTPQQPTGTQPNGSGGAQPRYAFQKPGDVGWN